MPSSRPNAIPLVIHLLRQLKPQSILDVGIGFGKWGHLFREYTDIQAAETNPSRYQRKNWQVTIDGIEGYPEYVTEMHRFLYNHLFLGNACKLIQTVPNYDLIFMGDMIEHLPKEEGLQFLRNAFAKANKALIVSTPEFETAQPSLCGNELEQHRSLWTADDFLVLPGAITRHVDGGILLAILLKPGVKEPTFTSPPAPNPESALRYSKTRESLVRLISKDQPFILVDDDQLPEPLPHTRVLPFLEKGGVYWGPPGDDQGAVSECERLRKSGAKFIAFVWSSFWWLEHFKGFRRHLYSNYRCLQEDDALVVFDLQARVPSLSEGEQLEMRRDPV